MKYRKNEYVHGSTARKISQQKEFDYSVKKQPVKRIIKKSNIKSLFIIICIVFFMLMLLMYRYAILTEINFRYSEKNKEYNELKNENNKLRSEIQSGIDLKIIEEKAKAMGMLKPDRNQIIYTEN